MPNNMKSILKTTNDNRKHVEENNLEENLSPNDRESLSNKVEKKSHKREFQYPR